MDNTSNQGVNRKFLVNCHLNFAEHWPMMKSRVTMDMTKFATITSTSELLGLTDELLKLGKGDEVIFVPYRPEVLAELLEITPDKKTGKRKFTQARFSEACEEAAEELGHGRKAAPSQKTVSSYCR